MSDRPFPGEGLAEFRARRARELADQANGVGAGPSADEQVEAAKEKIRQGNAAKARQRVSDPKNMVNHMDSAAAQDDAVKATHKRLAGGVKPVIPDTAADKGSSDWNKMSEADQIAAARGSKPSPAPAAPKPITVKADAETSAKNNMGVPRGGDRGGVLGGVASKDSKSDLDAARAAATKGTRGTSSRQAEANAARQSQRRSAASAAPVASAPKAPAPARQTGFTANNTMANAYAASLNLSGPSTPVSQRPAPAATAAPVANPATASPVATSPNSGVTAADRFVPRGGLDRAAIGAGKPKIGSEVTHGINATRGPVANTRRQYQEHIAGGGNDESYWAARDAKKSAKPAAKAPAVATVEPIAQPKSAPSTPVNAVPPKRPTPSAPITPQTGGGTVPPLKTPPMPSRASTPQNTPMAAPQAAKAQPSSAPVETPRATPGRTVSPVVTPSSPTGTGRPGVTPPARVERPESVGRGGLHQHGEHNVNVGGHNYGSITQNNNTYNVNYGVNNGSMGNVEHGYGRGGRAAGTGHSGGHAGGHAMHGHEPHFDIWARDANGLHSLHHTVQEVTGKVDGRGHKMPSQRQSGGNQQPLNGSPRATGGTSPAPASTGTTLNWQGPAHQNPTSASGNGTANGTP